MAEGKSLRIAYGEELCELGRTNEKVVVLDADLAGATMTKLFKAQYPQRFFDFGIAEAIRFHLCTVRRWARLRADSEQRGVCECQREVLPDAFRPFGGRRRRQPPEH